MTILQLIVLCVTLLGITCLATDAMKHASDNRVERCRVATDKAACGQNPYSD